MSIILAFSGGLDTSFCVPYLKETYHQPVHTITVNTGGVSPASAGETPTSPTYDFPYEDGQAYSGGIEGNVELHLTACTRR